MLETKYDHKRVEKGKYENWKEKGYFKSGDTTKKPFCIVIPPPNVTGKLHLGHAWDTSIQDVLIRYKRMCGYDALWLPGMDHAGIATQAKVDRKLREEGMDPRSMDREEWLKKAWAWKDEYASNIHDQWATLGLSLDYTKERFTLDEGLSEAVRKVFVHLYEEGLIYRGERIINWDPEAMTALSNEEVIYKDVEGAFYHLKYFIEGSDEYLEVATTRPETLFGDTAVAVNPNDERYKHLIGKNVILPILNEKIPVVGDEHADMEFGTGVVKITPAHDPNDFEVGNRHNLERKIIMNPNGTMNALCGEKYDGMDRFACREAVVKDLEEQGILIRIEKITHNVGHSERTDVMVEPYLSKQWFVRMRPLADAVLENQKNKDTKVNFWPSRFEKIMNHWMEITYDWCISRQLWWGHRIPAWYRGDEVYVGIEEPEGEGWIQDEDVLDTWFSSALWPFSTLGWPEGNELIERYYPNDCLVTGYDIIPFWVNRMTFQGLHFTGKRPFEDCIIHGLIRDKEGRKMSKSLGNGVDPMDVIEAYGADALRYYLTTEVSAGMDLKYDEDKVKSTWNFINKLWNASRFVLLNIENLKEEEFTLNGLKEEDEWILSKLNKAIFDTRKYLDKYEFNNAGASLYNFIWNDFCDNYIEMAKFSADDVVTKSTLYHVLSSVIRAISPFMPYVSEEIYTMMPFKKCDSIMVDEYPTYSKEYDFDTKDVDDMLEFVRLFRTFKLENGVGKEFYIEYNSKANYRIITNLLKLDGKTEEQKGNASYDVIYKEYSISVFFNKDDSSSIDAAKKRISELEESIARRKKLLANDNYTSKAPQDIVLKDRQKLQEEEAELEKLRTA